MRSHLELCAKNVMLHVQPLGWRSHSAFALNNAFFINHVRGVCDKLQLLWPRLGCVQHSWTVLSRMFCYHTRGWFNQSWFMVTVHTFESIQDCIFWSTQNTNWTQGWHGVLTVIKVPKFVNSEPSSSVIIVSGYELDDRTIEVRSPAEAKWFSL
jgi:hypothetical protein